MAQPNLSPLKILITGAAGNIGSALASGLRGQYSLLRLTDRKLQATPNKREEAIEADLGDAGAVQKLARDIDCIVHLAGIAQEDSWESILANNVHVTVNVFEAARMAGVRRIVFASSNHVTGYYPSTQEVFADSPPRPDSRYAVSKVFGEALARLYWDKHGISATCLRIGSFRQLPQDQRQLRTWISPRDMVALVRCAITNTRRGFDIFYGVSANRRSLWRDHADAIGFQAQDDAETHAPALAATAMDNWEFHGGSYCATDPGSPPKKTAFVSHQLNT